MSDLLKEYRDRYGDDPADYALETLTKWKTGKRRMSGRVMKRLFDLLPPRMPLRQKYRLAESVWAHTGPTSHHKFIVGPEAEISVLGELVADKLSKFVLKHNIPEELKRRFDWLAAGDVQVKEALLNYFQKKERALALGYVEEQLPILQQQMKSRGDITGRANVTLTINKHRVEIEVVNGAGEKIKEVGLAYSSRSSRAEKGLAGSADEGQAAQTSHGIYWVIGAAVAVGVIALILR